MVEIRISYEVPRIEPGSATYKADTLCPLYYFSSPVICFKSPNLWYFFSVTSSDIIFTRNAILLPVVILKKLTLLMESRAELASHVELARNYFL